MPIAAWRAEAPGLSPVPLTILGGGHVDIGVIPVTIRSLPPAPGQKLCEILAEKPPPSSFVTNWQLVAACKAVIGGFDSRTGVGGCWMNGSSVVTRRSEAVPLSRPRMTAKAPFIMESESGRAGVRLLTGRC